MAPRRRRIDTRFVATDVDLEHVEDDDGDVSSDGDLCDRCECPREFHEDGVGECSVCGRCKRFKESKL